MACGERSGIVIQMCRITPQPSTYFLVFLVDRPPFDDVRIRRAFVHAVDREALVRDVSKGQYLPATGGFVPLGMPGHLPGVGLPWDPGRARQLLTEAGYPDGKGFPDVECVARTDQADLGENLKAQWEENLGVKIRWETVEWQAILARLGEQLGAATNALVKRTPSAARRSRFGVRICRSP